MGLVALLYFSSRGAKTFIPRSLMRLIDQDDLSKVRPLVHHLVRPRKLRHGQHGIHDRGLAPPLANSGKALALKLRHRARHESRTGGDAHRQQLYVQNANAQIKRDVAAASAAKHHDPAIHSHGIYELVSSRVTDRHQANIHAFTAGEG